MLTEEFSATKKVWIQLRLEAHYYKTHHRKALEREQVLKTKVRELELTLVRQEIQAKELITGFQKTIAEQNNKIDRLTKRVRELTAQNIWLKQRLFGRQSEQGGSSLESLGLEDARMSVVAMPQTKRPRGQQAGTTGHGRKRRKDLPVVEIIHDLKEYEKVCPICGLEFQSFPTTADSDDIHYQVCVTRRVHKRKCYVPTCRCGIVTGIVTAPPVPKLIPKGMFSVEFWAHILAEKFLFQRPLARILQALDLQGLRVSQGTITGGLQKIKEVVYPLYTRILERNRSANHWHMDETRWLMFAVVEGKTGCRWWLWVAVTKDTVVYLLDSSRSSSVPREHLGENPKGILSVDRYAAYKALGSEDLKLSFCWGHVRRDYVRIYDTYPELQTWAQDWIGRINLLFHLNNNRRDVLRDKERFHLADTVLRQEISRFQDAYLKELSKKEVHPVARKALESLQRHWDGLLVFVNHPEIPMDNNLSERKLREPVLGRKNYYGSGAVWSGDLTVALFTIFQTARHNGLDPVKYLTSYLHAAADNHGNVPTNIDSFLPWNLSQEQKIAWKHPP
jgi:transposase